MVFETAGSEPLTAHQTLRLTPSEKLKLKEDARLAGLSMSELVRRRYFGRPIIASGDAALVRELIRIGGILSARDEGDSEAFLQLRDVLEKVSGRDREGG